MVKKAETHRVFAKGKLNLAINENGSMIKRAVGEIPSGMAWFISIPK